MRPILQALVLLLMAGPTLADAALTLVTTVGKASDYCFIPAEPHNCSVPAATSVTVDAGEDFAVGYTITNTGTVMLDTHTLNDSVLGIILDTFPYELPPGASAFITHRGTAPLTSGDVTYTASWVATNAGGDSASTNGSYHVVVPAPAFEMESTVGKAATHCTNPGNPADCSIPTVDHVVAEPGEPLVSAYLTTNTGLVTLAEHDLSDSVLGTLLNDLPYLMTPGSSAFLTQRFIAPTAPGSYTHSANWTARTAGGNAFAFADTYTVDVQPILFNFDVTVGFASDFCSDPEEISSCVAPTRNAIDFIPGRKLLIGYQIHNAGAFTLPTHTLGDSELGTLLSAYPYSLAAGASTFLLQFDTPVAPAARSATWTVKSTYGVEASRIANYTIWIPLLSDGFE